MEREKVLEMLRSLVDEAYKTEFLQTYPTSGRSVLGIPPLQLNEIARNNVGQGDWQTVVDKEICGDTYEEVILRAAITLHARPLSKAWYETLAKYVALMDTPQLCDAVCLVAGSSVEDQMQTWAFLQPYWEQGTDMEQRFALVMLLDHFMTADVVDATLEILKKVRPAGAYASQALAWAFSVSYMCFPKRTFSALETLHPAKQTSHWTKEFFNSVITEIEAVPRLNELDKAALQPLKIS